MLCLLKLLVNLKVLFSVPLLIFCLSVETSMLTSIIAVAVALFFQLSCIASI